MYRADLFQCKEGRTNNGIPEVSQYNTSHHWVNRTYKGEASLPIWRIVLVPVATAVVGQYQLCDDGSN